jgi:type II secretory pathway predicted ATPase ExeA
LPRGQTVTGIDRELSTEWSTSMYYDTYYKLTADPFRLSPDHRFVFGHASYAEARAYLEYALYRGEGFIIITGGPGTGKTTLINEILAGIDSRTHLNVAILNSTQLEGSDLLQMVAAAFGLRYSEKNKAAVLLEIQQFLTQQGHKGRRSVLIVDEAQGLSTSAVEELRQLANLQLKDRLLLQVFLVGQEALRELVRAPGMEHLSQRIVAASHLEPLDLNDTVAYIEHRLKRVGWRGDPKLSGAVLRLIYRFSAGIPRRINLICSRLFLHGGMGGKHELHAEDAQSVIEDLQREYLLAPEGAESAEPLVAAAAPADEAHEDDLALPRSKGTPEGETAGDVASQREAQEPLVDDVSAQTGPGGQRSVRWQENASPAPEPKLRETLGRVIDTLEQEGDSLTLPPLGAGHHKTQAAPAKRRGASQTAPGRVRKGARIADNKVRKRNPPRESVRSRSNEASQPLPPAPETRLKGGRWAAIALVAVVGGLAVAISNGVFDLDREGSMQALTKRVDDAIGRVSGQLDPALPAEETPALNGDSQTPADGRETASSAEGAASFDASGEADRLQVEPGLEATAGNAGGQTGIPAGLADDGGDEPVAATERSVESPVVETHTVGQIARHSLDEETADEPLTVSETPRRDEVQTVLEPSAVDPATAPVQPVSAAALTEESQSQADLEAERERLALAAKQRFAQRLERVEPETETVRAATPPASKAPEPVAAVTRREAVPDEVKTSVPRIPRATQAPVAVRAQQPVRAERADNTVPAEVRPSRPKITPAPTVVASAPAIVPQETVSRRDRLKTALLGGAWNSQGKPASLLPSDITLCKRERSNISCQSVPQNVNTKYGEAVYKVEATLKDFSEGGEFLVSYRTLVRLLKGGGDKAAENSGSGGWQVSEHAMSCRLINAENVSCRDQKGATRDYNR